MSKSYLGVLGEAPVVMIIGAVAYWWDTDEYQHWNTPEHWHYVAWRDRVDQAVQEAGYLSYRHWEAFKGTWNNKMQKHNNSVLADADFIINIKPDYVWSEGCDEELAFAKQLGKTVIYAPAPETEEEFTWHIKTLLETMRDLATEDS